MENEQLPLAILGRIREEKQTFRTKSVRIAKGMLFNQYNTLQRIELYYNSQFETGEFDDDGFKKYFYNINRKPCEIATKEIDLDTKDIIIRPENGDYLLADIMARRFKQWTKDQGFAKDLNEYAEEAPKYGTVVVKKVPKTGRLHTVDLVNGFIITNQNAKSLDYTNIIEPHIYTYDEIRQQGWDEAKVNQLVRLYQALDKTEIEVDERYGYVRESELKEGGATDKMVYTLAIVGGAEEVETAGDQGKVQEQGVVLYHMPIAKHPYKEWHFAKIKKRWLGLGFVETLFDPQMARNESKYYKRKGMLWTTLHIFQTDDDTVNKNMMLDAKDGEVIKRSRGTAPIAPVPVEERNLAEYQSEDNDWDRNAMDLTFSTEIVGGEKLPVNTPATVAVITDANVKRFFDKKREDFGIFVKSLCVDDIMPQFVEKTAEEHIFSLAGSYQDRDQFEKFILEARLTAAFEKYIADNGAVPSLEEWNQLQETEAMRLASRPSLDIKIPKDTFKNFKHRLDVVITKENEDTEADIQGRLAFMNLVTSNPNALLDPLTRPIMLELAHRYGLKNVRIPNLPARPPQQAGPGMQQQAAPAQASMPEMAMAGQGGGQPMEL